MIFICIPIELYATHTLEDLGTCAAHLKKCMQDITRAHLVLLIWGAVAIDRNVVGNDDIPSISSIVDNISQFRVDVNRSSGESGVHDCEIYTR
jgi:hypothetical protein